MTSHQVLTHHHVMTCRHVMTCHQVTPSHHVMTSRQVLIYHHVMTCRHGTTLTMHGASAPLEKTSVFALPRHPKQRFTREKQLCAVIWSFWLLPERHQQISAAVCQSGPMKIQPARAERKHANSLFVHRQKMQVFALGGHWVVLVGSGESPAELCWN